MWTPVNIKASLHHHYLLLEKNQEESTNTANDKMSNTQFRLSTMLISPYGAVER